MWFEVNKIGNVRGGRALCLLRVTQTSAGSANRFVFFGQPVAVENLHLEVIEQQRLAIFSLPFPVVDRRERCRESVFACRRLVVVRIVTLQRERRGLRFSRETGFDERTERGGEEQFARSVGFERGAYASPRIASCLLCNAKLARRDVEKSRADGFAGRTDGGEKHWFACFK